MKHFIALALLALASTQALAVTATWTGQSEYVTTVSYQQAIRCQYNTGSGPFWMLFKSFCPATVEVE